MKPCFHVVFLLVLASLPCHTLADSGRSLVFNVSSGGYPPYTIIEDDRIHGLMWEVMAAFAEDQELTLVGREVPTKRVVSELQAGRVDVTMRAPEWIQSPEQFAFTRGIVPMRDIVVSPADAPVDYQQEADLNGLRIVAQLGFGYPVFDDLVAAGQAERFDVRTESELLRRVRDAAHFQAGIGDERTLRWVAGQQGWSKDFHFSRKAVSEVQYRFMFARENEPLADRFNNWFEQWQENGELRALKQRYR